MRHEFHPEALLEFEEAVRFYKEYGRTLGRRFAREIRAADAATGVNSAFAMQE